MIVDDIERIIDEMLEKDRDDMNKEEVIDIILERSDIFHKLYVGEMPIDPWWINWNMIDYMRNWPEKFQSYKKVDKYIRNFIRECYGIRKI